MDQQDGELRACLAEAVRGDLKAGEQLIARLYPLVAKIVRSHVPRDVAAEDWEQEVFVRILAGLDRYRGDAPVEHCAVKVAVNVCLDQLRKRKRLRRRNEVRWADLSDAEVMAVKDSAGAADGDSVAAADLVNRLLDELPAEDQLVIRMLDLEHRPVAEIAELMSRGESWVRVRAFRARKTLAQTLERLEREMRR